MSATRTQPTEVLIDLRGPHAGQQMVRNALATADGVMLRCGRRWGKTVIGEDTAIEVAAGILLTPSPSGPRLGRVGWFGPNTDYTLPVWESFKTRLAPLAKRVSEQDQAIWLHGSTFEAPNVEIWTCHNNEHPGRSRDYDLVVFDEAGLIDALDTIWEQAVAPTLAVSHGKALMLGTPLGRRTPFNVRFDRVAAGLVPRWKAFQRPSTDNPLVTQAYVDELARLAAAESPRAVAVHRQEFHGEPMDDGSNPIGLAHIANSVSVQSTQPVVCWGIDLAKSVDWTVVVGLDQFGRWAFCERWQEDWPVTRRRLVHILKGHACEVHADALAYVDKTGVGSPIVSDLQLQLDNVVGKTFTQAYRRAIIQRLVVGLPQHRFSIPDGWLRAELESLGAAELSTGVQYSVPNGMHDDGIMAFALAAHAFDSVDVPVHAPMVSAYDVDNRSTVKIRRTPAPTLAEWQTTPHWGTNEGEDVEL